MFEIKTKTDKYDCPLVRVFWEISENLQSDLQKDKAVDPYLLLLIVSGYNYHYVFWEEKIIPLFAKETYFAFSLPGKYRIIGTIIWRKGGGRPVIETYSLNYERNKIDKIDGCKIERHYCDVSAAVVIRQEFFAESKDEQSWILWGKQHPRLVKIINSILKIF
ncbi:hypothetical protein COV49_01000 [Candidatus Falkowbacteria bacterium CG11_big_fil_rev_8_21_14_0_20_39_10]|uniref:Uncharacterized protein n=1 Tax=Candidatus Falkowbacteria bacterium CG11_big_fil_rev_8_21_14_0_20_39_10 TaxID=1974570 RepID=A0A2M6KA10_9BACT|nr:MAG: hypothetical protein COV49_01000 [Candidatus Falkowbacteria bacterium CG11_big_fil_rev_8_21_14_0_20_39_10]